MYVHFGRAKQGDGRLSGAEVLARVNRVTTIAVTAANVGGAITTFVYLTLLLKVRHPPPVDKVLLWNWPAGAVYLLIASIIAPRWLRTPLVSIKVSATVWAVAAVVFGLINLHFSPEVAANAMTGIIVGGLVTVAIAYLVGERAARPITARALRFGAPIRPVASGVVVRTLLAWGLATGVPVLSMAWVAEGMLVGDNPRDDATILGIVFLAAVALGAGALAIVIAAKGIADPVRSVRRAMAQVEEGVTDLEVKVDDASEVGLLQAGFNRMAAGLAERERLRDLFGRHVGEAVARQALDAGVELGGEVREAAVLFVDVVGSTTLAADAPPQEVVKRLNVFFGIVLELVSEHGGWVNKFEGDAALCIFGVPTEMHDSAGAALAAARKLCSRLEAESPLDAAMGVSAGEVVAGNIGAAERFEYTVIGDPVNEAARLTEAAKEHSPRVLASGRAIGRAAPEEAAHWQLGDEVTLRGRSGPTVLAAPSESVVPAN